MSHGDNIAKPVKPRCPTLVIWRCRRCLALETVPATNPLVTVREAAERGGAAMLRTHECQDGTGCTGVLDLVGTGVEMTLAEMMAGRSRAP
jgi:hypothetical protein